MTEEIRSTAIPKWMVSILTVMALVMGVQSLVLFRVWHDMPRDRKGLGAEGSQSVNSPVREEENNDTSSPHVRKWGKKDIFSNMDELWNGFDREGWDPFNELKRMREQMDSLFDDSFGRFNLSPGAAKREDRMLGFSPKLDLQEKDDCYVARMDVPGVNKSDISVHLDDRLLTVSGQTSEATETKKEGDQVLRKERKSGKFKRSITLPGPVLADKLDARYENGVLVITIPKAKEDQATQTVPVK